MLILNQPRAELKRPPQLTWSPAFSPSSVAMSATLRF